MQVGSNVAESIIDAIEEVQTEDIQKLGGMEALDEPYTTISFWGMIRKRGGWLTALYLVMREGIEPGRGIKALPSLIMGSLRRSLRE